MKHTARANKIYRELKKFEMNSGHCVELLVDVLSEGDELKKVAKQRRERITLLERAATARDRNIKTLQNQKSKAEDSLEKLTKAAERRKK